MKYKYVTRAYSNSSVVCPPHSTHMFGPSSASISPGAAHSTSVCNYNVWRGGQTGGRVQRRMGLRLRGGGVRIGPFMDDEVGSAAAAHLYVCVCVCVKERHREREREREREGERECVCVCVCVCVCACVCVCVCLCVCVCVCVFVLFPTSQLFVGECLSHITLMNGSCRAYKYVMSLSWPCVCVWVMSLV